MFRWPSQVATSLIGTLRASIAETQAVRRERLRDFNLRGVEVEVMTVTAVCGKLAIHFEKVSVRKVPDHLPQVGGNGRVPVFPGFAVLQRTRLPAVPARLLEYAQNRAVVT